MADTQCFSGSLVNDDGDWTPPRSGAFDALCSSEELTSMLETSPSLPPLLRKSRPPGEIATHDTARAI